MLRLKQIQANILNPPSDSKTKDDMMDEFYISPEVKNRTLAQRKARISNVTARKKMTATPVQKPKEFDENQLVPAETPLMLKAPPAYSEGNPNLLFESPSAKEQKNNPVVLPLSINPLEELRDTREEINILTSDIQKKLARLTVLEQRVTCIEANLTVNNKKNNI